MATGVGGVVGAGAWRVSQSSGLGAEHYRELNDLIDTMNVIGACVIVAVVVFLGVLVWKDWKRSR